MKVLLAKDNMETRILDFRFTVGTIKRSDTRLFLQDAWVVRDASPVVCWDGLLNCLAETGTL